MGQEHKTNEAVIEVPPGSAPVKVEAPRKKRKKFPFQGFIQFQGLKIDVENKQGSIRRGTAPDGKTWETWIFWPYGEIRGTEGTDSDPLDCYVGPNADSPLVVVIHQRDPETGDFDEDKVMLGFNSEEEAVGAYKRQYDHPGFYKDHTAMPIGQLGRWVQDKNNRGERVTAKGGFFTDLIKGNENKGNEMKKPGDVIRNKAGREGAVVESNKGGFVVKWIDDKGGTGFIANEDVRGKEEKDTRKSCTFFTDLIKGGGPYIGKRGGKWADPEHKIPWKEEERGETPGMEAKRKAREKHTEAVKKVDAASFRARVQAALKEAGISSSDMHADKNMFSLNWDFQGYVHQAADAKTDAAKASAQKGMEDTTNKFLARIKAVAGEKKESSKHDEAKADIREQAAKNEHIKGKLPADPETWDYKAVGALKEAIKAKEAKPHDPKDSPAMDAAIRVLSNWMLVNHDKGMAQIFPKTKKAASFFTDLIKGKG